MTTRLSLLLVLSATAALLADAPAAANSPWWHLSSSSRPTYLPPGGKGEIILTIANLGDADAGGEATPVKTADRLPLGLEALSVNAVAGPSGKDGPVKCEKSVLTCSFEGTLPPYDQIEVRIGVAVKPGARSGEENQVSVTGGNAPAASISRPIVVGEEPIPFGVEGYEAIPEEEGGAADTQAGSHPFQLTSAFSLNRGADPAKPPALPKDLNIKLPPGLIGNPQAISRCTLAQFFNEACPLASVVGVATLTADAPGSLGLTTLTVPVVNVEPSIGEPARFGLVAEGISVFLGTSVRSGIGEDYGLTLSIDNVTQVAVLLSVTVTLWGTPGDPSHDSARGSACLQEARGGEPGLCEPLGEHQPPAFLTLPTSCTAAPLQSAIEVASWAQPKNFLSFPSSQPLPTLDGCNRLPFDPAITAQPSSDAAASPTGLGFDLSVNDEGLLSSAGLAQSQIKAVKVALPEGMTINPSVAAGLRACSEARFESSTVNAEPGTGCPEESKIGKVEIESPVFPQAVDGSIYVARQGENPLHSRLALYVVARNPELGVLLRIAANVEPNEATGRVVTSFDDLPQLPLSHLRLSFRQGPRSLLVTPPSCAAYTVVAELNPYSNPEAALPATSQFELTSGPEGAPCPSGATPPFHPGLTAGTLANGAGSHSPLYLRLTRTDSEGEIAGYSVTLPPGLSAKLAGVATCPEAAIGAARSKTGVAEEESPSCPAASEIGRTLIGAGAGPVLTYVPGKLYLAGPYRGSPLSIVTIIPARLGPLDLGTVVVRSALGVDPETGQISIDASSSPLPRIVDGIPLRLRDIRIYMDRPGLVVNPTNCEPMAVRGTVLGFGARLLPSARDLSATVENGFQAADCAALGFRPKLALRLSGGVHRNGHPRLRAVLTPRNGGANIARAALTLPPTELLDPSHIRAVCTMARFAAQSCPPGSLVGFAKAETPLLEAPLRGPVYLRASRHRLPDLVADLYGRIHIVLDGRLDAVHGALRVGYDTMPDVPLTRFVLTLLGGKRGLLVNSEDLCASRPHASADLGAHNGRIKDLRPALAVRCSGARR